MFIHHRTQGFVLKKEGRREADQLFTIFTKDYGKLEISGRAVRKISSKLSSGVELFSLSEIEFIQGKSRKTLTDAVLIEKFAAIKKSLRRLRMAYKVSEVLDALVSNREPDEKIWRLLIETFTKLNTELPFTEAKVKMRTKFSSQENWKLEMVYYYFFWNFISILGYRPELYCCVHCRKKIISPENYFSQKEGGVICQSCLNDGQKITPETIKILRIILKRDWMILLKLKISLQYLKELSVVSKKCFLFLRENLSSF